MNDYERHDALSLAALVAAGEVTSAELLDVARTRARACNPNLNAVVRWMDDHATTRVQGELTGSLAGVPFVLKDLFQDLEGVPTSNGCKALVDVPAQQTTVAVQRYLDAGLVIFAKTSTPEFGAKGITEPEAFGPCRNPWNRDHTPGGSSGGAAALVAAGVVPAASASDGGGSIRIPAACCGLFGLKPAGA